MQKSFIYVFFFLITCSTLSISAEVKEAIAKVYGRTIYREDIQGKGKSLESLVLRPLYERFIKKHHIVATESEINEFLTAMGDALSTSNSPDERAMMREMAKSSVLQWKVSKALYEKYGGEVIFQQANPLEPIGAERRFLEEQEKSGAFQILDPNERKKFFDYYVRPQPMVIPPSEVNYERPWWKK